MSTRNTPLSIKFIYQNTTRQLRLEGPIPLSDFISQIRSICAIEPNQHVEFTYTDEDGDLVTFSTENEWKALIHDAALVSFPKLQVVTSTPAPYLVASAEEVTSSNSKQEQVPIPEPPQQPSSSTSNSPGTSTEEPSAEPKAEEITLDAIIADAETLAVQFQSILEQQPEFLDHVKKVGEQFHQWGLQQATSQFHGCPRRRGCWQGGCGKSQQFNSCHQQRQQFWEERKQHVLKQGLKTLGEMGFPESEEIKELLQRYDGNVERVVEILLRPHTTEGNKKTEAPAYEY